MKIGILTQPLLNNYGGLLQNYALQLILKRLGHEPITIDYIPKSGMGLYILSCIKTILLFFIPSKRRPLSSHPRRLQRNSIFESFVTHNSIKTKTISKLNKSLIQEYKLDAVVVGSDQVWRPIYTKCIEDYFLRFLRSEKIKRVAYAASFGVDQWEFDKNQASECQILARLFDAVSVREESGVQLCKQYLGIDSKWVLDPTLLLTKADYEALLDPHRTKTEDYIAAYILDNSDEKLSEVEKLSQEKNLPVKIFTAGTEATLAVEDWLAIFHDASYVITDSFHGTVFSIVFEKQFKCLGNDTRGSSRFKSLLKLYNEKKLGVMREKSLRFLQDSLI